MVELKCTCGSKKCKNSIRVFDDYLMVDHAIGRTDMLIYSSPKSMRAFAREILKSFRKKAKHAGRRKSP